MSISKVIQSIKNHFYLSMK